MIPDWALCRCEHTFDGHEHFNSSTHCGRCDCRAFRRPPLLKRLLDWISR